MRFQTESGPPALFSGGKTQAAWGTLRGFLEYNEMMDILQIPMEVYSMSCCNQNNGSQWNWNTGCGCGQAFGQNDINRVSAAEWPEGRGCMQPFEPGYANTRQIPVVEWPEGYGCVSPYTGFDYGQTYDWPGYCGCRRGCGCGCGRRSGCCGC